MFHRWHCLLACCLVYATAGCRKPAPDSAPDAAAAANSGAAAGTEPGVSTPPSAPAEGDLTAVLEELTQVVRKYSFEKQHRPADLNELVAAGYLASAPVAPAGKRFSINAKTMRVVLEKQ